MLRKSALRPMEAMHRAILRSIKLATSKRLARRYPLGSAETQGGNVAAVENTPPSPGGSARTGVRLRLARNTAAADSAFGILPTPFLWASLMPISNRSAFLRWSVSDGVASRTAL
jgi:hypothetical protein